MRFLADENFPILSARLLRQSGHNVFAVIEEMPGSSDERILAVAHKEQRILLTFDRDYGELIYRLHHPSPPGVIYLRFDPATPDEPAFHVLRLLATSSLSIEGRFTVTERDRLRQRTLPKN